MTRWEELKQCLDAFVAAVWPKVGEREFTIQEVGALAAEHDDVWAAVRKFYKREGRWPQKRGSGPCDLVREASYGVTYPVDGGRKVTLTLVFKREPGPVTYRFKDAEEEGVTVAPRHRAC